MLNIKSVDKKLLGYTSSSSVEYEPLSVESSFETKKLLLKASLSDGVPLRDFSEELIVSTDIIFFIFN